MAGNESMFSSRNSRRRSFRNADGVENNCNSPISVSLGSLAEGGECGSLLDEAKPNQILRDISNNKGCIVDSKTPEINQKHGNVAVINLCQSQLASNASTLPTRASKRKRLVKSDGGETMYNSLFTSSLTSIVEGTQSDGQSTVQSRIAFRNSLVFDSMNPSGESL